MSTLNNETWINDSLDEVYEVGYNQALLHASGGGSNTKTSDVLYEAKAQIIAKLQEELESLLPNGKNLTTSAYGLWVQHELETRLLKAKAPQGGEEK